MEKTDLTLVPIEELLDEAKNRCTAFICGYTNIDLDRNGRYITIFNAANGLVLTGLCEGVKEDILGQDND